MPTLVLLGYTARIAITTNAMIVTLPSFSAFATHLLNARFDWWLLIPTSVASVLGAQAGAAFMARRVKSLTLTRIFAGALVLLALQRAWILIMGEHLAPADTHTAPFYSSRAVLYRCRLFTDS